jgi:hypothetical protein
MPVSTEILNDDIKELRGDIHKLDVGLAELRTEVKDAIALGKWAATLFIATILTSGVGTIIWGASLTTKVYGMETRGNEKFQELNARFDEKFKVVEARFDKLESSIDARFDKLEASIARILEQTKPAAK